jgi:anti-sigma regulatory factor (Ser/Thr protein kinase)
VCPQLELEFTAIPEGVTSARAAITTLCQSLDLEDDVVDRVKIAVNEACINCVQHAYAFDANGGTTYMLEARCEDDALVVIVHDYGVGMLADSPSANAGLGLGLRLMEQLADRVSITSNPGRGTRVVMRFVLPPPA